MGEDERGETNPEQTPEFVLRFERDVEPQSHKGEESEKDEQATDEAVLLADDGKNKVVVHDGAGEKAQFVERVLRLEALAVPSARTDGGERLVDRPTRALRVEFRIEKGDDALTLVGAQSEVHHQRDDGNGQQDEREQVARRNSRRVKHGQHDRQPDKRRTEVGLGEDHGAGDSGDGRAQRDAQRSGHVIVLGKKKSHQHDAGKDGELRWLETHHAEIEPTATAIDRLADEVDGNQPEQTRDVDRQRPAPDPMVIGEGNAETNDETDTEPDELAVPKVLLTHPRRAVDGKDTKETERDDQAEQRPVEPREFFYQVSHVA